ncbi:HtaA domain-containing protein [Streptomyces sp. NPDC001941]|uniref:HtaA domain-containing protein n=1 Tax=Streptomyces sp. NPDC001941 TaxID=3154659 RepID=UPI00331E2BD6
MAATRRPIALAAAVATAAALGATAFALPALADSAPAAGPGDVPAMDLKEGTLDWGVDQVLREHFGAMKDGVTVADGAKQAEKHGPFTFVDGTGRYAGSPTHTVATAFKGSVRFYGYGGQFDVKFSDLKLNTKDAKSGEILADVTAPGKDGKSQTQQDVAVAALDLTNVRPSQGAGGVMVYKDIPATLTQGGVAVLGARYKVGQALDPATLTVKADMGGGNGGGQNGGGTNAGQQGGGTNAGQQGGGTNAGQQGGGANAGQQGGGANAGQQGGSTNGQGGGANTGSSNGQTGGSTDGSTGGGEEQPGKVLNGKLSWGVKKTWRDYVTGMCGGKVTTLDGASGSTGGYDFAFGSATLDAKARKADARFKGGVRFECAAHGIGLTFANPRVEADGTGGKLIADSTNSQGKTTKGVVIATLDLAKADFTAKDGTTTLADIPAKLTAEGSAQFSAPGGQGGYPAGTALDPVTLVLSTKSGDLPSTTGGSSTGGSSGTGGDTAGGSTGGSTAGGSTTTGGTVGGGSAGGSGSLAATGSSTPTGALLGAAAATAAAGAAVVFAVRRRRDGDATA